MQVVGTEVTVAAARERWLSTDPAGSSLRMMAPPKAICTGDPSRCSRSAARNSPSGLLVIPVQHPTIGLGVTSEQLERPAYGSASMPLIHCE